MVRISKIFEDDPAIEVDDPFLNEYLYQFLKYFDILFVLTFKFVSDFNLSLISWIVSGGFGGIIALNVSFIASILRPKTSS